MVLRTEIIRTVFSDVKDIVPDLKRGLAQDQSATAYFRSEPLLSR